MKNQAIRREKQSGSLIIWIFAAIFLFGALSYTVSKSTRSGITGLGNEKAQLAATEIITYGNAVRNAVKMLQINGIPLQTLDFRMHNLYDLGGTNLQNLYGNVLCTNNSCKVFSTNGGGIKPEQFYEYGRATPSWTHPSYTQPGGVGFSISRVEGFGTNAPDVIMRIAVIDPAICTAINKMANIEGAVYPGPGNNVQWIDPVPTNLANTTGYVYGIVSPQIAGKNYFCTTNDFFANFVIVAR